ncbi:EamA family transporter [Halorussus sp. AFM4]|uniref:EamA family transporter n=1 Tax=Halorussus sp. AFM4 TaxID=3421651 RepID=UPI003EBEBA47
MQVGSLALGLAAAVGWGVADFLVARVGDRLGTVATFAYAQLSGALVLAGAVAVVGAPTDLPPDLWLALGGLGVVGAAAYLLLYGSLQVGPVAVASPIAATNGAVAAVLGVVVLREPLGDAGAVGLALVTLGVVGSSVDVADLRRAVRGEATVLPGAALAVAASLALGSVMFALELFGDAVSLLALVLAIRAVGGLASLPLVVRSEAAVSPRLLAQLVAIGVVDAAAFVCFVLGLRAGRVAVVGPASSLFAVVTVVLAWLFLKESLTATQRVGIGLVLLGVPLLAGV